MCGNLVQEYRIWFKEILEILQTLCEDVVPAGRLDQEVYWQTKELYRTIKQGELEDIYTELSQYASDGKILLEPVKEALKTVKRDNIAEETIIYLRRKYARAILTSLQMLVNFAYLADAYLRDADEIGIEASKYFEIDTTDEVKRIRSGVVVQRKQIVAVKTEGCDTNQSGTKTYRFHTESSQNWKNSVAG